MSLDNVSVHGSIGSESVPTRQAAGVERKMRQTNYGEQMVTVVGKSPQYALANEGSYFVATNPTPGTAIAGITAADGLDDTEALLFLRNDASAAEGKRVYLDYIRLKCAAVGTNGTNFAYAMKLDTGNTRYSSGGSTITPVNTNMQSSDTAPVTMKFGAVVPNAATSSARLVSHDLVKPTLKDVGDQFIFDFGAAQKATAPLAVDGDGFHHFHITCPPVVLGPTDQFFLHEFAASQSVAAQYQFEMGFWVR